MAKLVRARVRNSTWPVGPDGLHGVAGKVEQRLHQLIGIGGQGRQAGIVVAEQLDRLPVFAGDQGDDPLQHFVNVYVLTLWPAHWTQQAVGERGQAIGFADDDPGELTELRRGQFPFKQLCGAPQAAQGIADLVGELADHAPAGVPLADERVLPVDLAPLGGIGKLDDHPAAGAAQRRNVAGHFDGRLALVGRGDADELAEDLALGRRTPEQVVDTAETGEQRLQGAAPAVPGADTEQVFRTGVEIRRACRPARR